MIDDGYQQERADVANLKFGLEFEILYPQFQNVTCEQCRAWWWDPETGQNVKDPATGKPQRRPPEAVPLCETPQGCVRGHYTKPKGLNARNKKFLAADKIYRETGLYPTDPVSQRNRMIIDEARATTKPAKGVNRG